MMRRVAAERSNGPFAHIGRPVRDVDAPAGSLPAEQGDTHDRV